MRHRIPLFVLAILTISSSIFAQSTAEWQTYWEKSDFLETPRYTETMDFSMRLAEESEMINYGTYGVSPQGRELVYLVLDKDGLSNPNDIRAKDRIVVMVEAAIHPGEAEGKDAMFALFRDIIIHEHHNEFLDDVSVIFIPIVNVDGHERFTPYSRINQNGPTEGGWRTTAHNLNLNRDFVKADAPEMQAWLRLFSTWNPEFFIDCHTTDGADYQYTLTYAVGGYSDKSIATWLEEDYLPEITQKMEDVNQPIFPYVSFRRWHDPRSGLYGGIAPPRYSTGYSSVRNRPGLLIETHMLKDYKTRVIATYEMVYSTLIYLQGSKSKLKKMIDNADKYVASDAFRKKPCVLKYSISQTDSTMVTFKGIDYSVEKSDLTGGNWFRYNGEEADFKLPFYNSLEPSVEVNLPEAYIIPVHWQNIIDRLGWHGIKYFMLSDSLSVDIQTYKFSNVKWRNSPYEGRFSIRNLDMEEVKLKKHYERGSVIIPLDQPNAYLIAFMFEPASEESFLRWGFFNAIFEQKEYVETYVMEEMAREMIKKDPSLKGKFENWKNENPDVQNNYYAQLMWFYRLTPYFDTELNLYPIGRIQSKEQLNKLLK